jgi:hypothetical protein
MLVTTRRFLIVVFGLCPAMALAGETPAGFTLGKAVPSDAWMYMHGVYNEETAWLQEEWGEVLQAFKDSGIAQDFMSLLFGTVSAEERAEAEVMLATATDLIAGVSWGDLVAKEFVFAERLGGHLPEYMFLAKGAQGSGEANAAGMAKILEYLASRSKGKLLVVPGTRDDVQFWTLIVEGENVGFKLFRRGDVIGLVFGEKLSNEVIQAISGGDQLQAVIDTPRFKQALAQVKPPEDSIQYMDLKMLLGDVRRMLESAMAKAEKPGEGANAWRKTVDDVLALADVADYSIMTIETQGRRQFTHQMIQFQPDKLDTPVAKMFLERKAFARFDKYIPADATSFSLSGFVDLGLLYDTIVKFVKTSIPGGEQHIATFNAKLVEFGFDPHRDLFSWWSGELISVTMPSAVVTPMGGGDSVWMIRVKDPALARQKTGAAIDRAAGALQAQQVAPLMITPANVDAEGFRQITHPLVMMLRLVIGVEDEWLMIGTSPEAINKCLAVAAGKAPSIRDNRRFQKEGLMPKGAAGSVSFEDMSNMGTELAQVLTMVSMVGGMVTAMMPADEPNAQELKPILTSIFSMLNRLGPVLMKLDFFSSQASMSTYSAGQVRNEWVMTYKEPSAGADQKAAPGTVTR